jgi:hypothetical protein
MARALQLVTAVGREIDDAKGWPGPSFCAGLLRLHHGVDVAGTRAIIETTENREKDGNGTESKRSTRRRSVGGRIVLEQSDPAAGEERF